MGIDLATWQARIGLNCYHMCRPLQTRWRSSGGQLYQPGVASWGMGEVMNDTPLVFKGSMTVVALSLILQYVVSSWSKLKGWQSALPLAGDHFSSEGYSRWWGDPAAESYCGSDTSTAGDSRRCGNKPRTWRYLYCYSTH